MSDDKKLPIADVPTVTNNSGMRSSDLVDISQLFKDMYPGPGDRIKQWVVDQRREYEWERGTCPTIEVQVHEDNTGTECRNSGKVPWTYLDHDCCYTCGELHEATQSLVVVQEWLAEKAKRPPIEQDRTKFEPHRELAPHPALGMLKR
jgi:hypothetical protein